MDIGIAGCGIAGLAAGTLLARQGHKVTIFDRFAAPAPVGAGLIIQPVGQAVLRTLGIGAAAVELGAPLTRMVGHEVVRGRRVLKASWSAEILLLLRVDPLARIRILAYSFGTSDATVEAMNTKLIPAKELEAAMLKLPVEERMRLLDALLSSLEPDPAIQQAWLELARQRRDEVRAGTVTMVPGDAALARVRQRLK
jgi:hypothetical protein